MIGLSARFSLLLILVPLTITAQQYPDFRVDFLLTTGIDYVINQNYGAAEDMFENLDREYPDLPLGKLYLAATEIAKNVDYAEPFSEDYIIELLELAEEQCYYLLDRDADNIWHQYFLALTTGYNGYYQALKNNYFSALNHGVTAIEHYNKCLVIDNGFYEAKLAIGMFLYWKNRLTEEVDFLPFVSADKQQGLNLIEEAVNYSSYNKHLAVYSLVNIYIDEEEPETAVSLAQEQLNKYAGSRFFMWLLARAYEDVDKAKAIEVYGKLLDSYGFEPLNNVVNEVVLKHKIAMLYNRMAEDEKAFRLCGEILQYELYSDYEYDRLERRMERVEDLYDELADKLGAN